MSVIIAERTAYIGRTSEGDRVFANMTLKRTRGGETTTHTHVESVEEFTASGFVIGKGCRNAYSFGQCLDALHDLVSFAPGWTRADAGSLLALWHRWHLNGLKAGCVHQKIVYAADEYGRCVPSLDLTLDCIVTGYKYGHSWLREEMPADVRTEILRLMALPSGNVPRNY